MRKSLILAVDIALAKDFVTLEIAGRGGGSSTFDGVVDFGGGLTMSRSEVLSLKVPSWTPRMRRVVRLKIEGVAGREVESGVEDDAGPSNIVEGRRMVENFRRSSDMVDCCVSDGGSQRVDGCEVSLGEAM